MLKLLGIKKPNTLLLTPDNTSIIATKNNVGKESINPNNIKPIICKMKGSLSFLINV